MELNGIRLGSFRVPRVKYETKTPARVFAVIATGAALFLYGVNAPHAQHIGEHLIGDWCEGVGLLVLFFGFLYWAHFKVECTDSPKRSHGDLPELGSSSPAVDNLKLGSDDYNDWMIFK